MMVNFTRKKCTSSVHFVYIYDLVLPPRFCETTTASEHFGHH